MKISPILFSTPMVQAILSGEKTMTRRIKKRQPKIDEQTGNIYVDHTMEIPIDDYRKFMPMFSPYGKPGDVLWVRETWFYHGRPDISNKKFIYKADKSKNIAEIITWKPSIHMPKSACRIWLEITNVRLERLQEITEADSVNEGVISRFGLYNCYHCDKQGHCSGTDKGNMEICDDGFYSTAKESFKSLWICINGRSSWETNPYVWVVEFKRIEKPANF